jgi:hypothetical protein
MLSQSHDLRAILWLEKAYHELCKYSLNFLKNEKSWNTFAGLLLTKAVLERA